MKIEKRKISELVHPDYNPRKDLQVTDFEYQGLKKNLERFGLVIPIIVNGRNGNIVGGNQRVAILQELGYDEVTVVTVDFDEKKEKALNVALNKIEGDWDNKTLKNVLDELMQKGIDLQGIGFTKGELNSMFPPEKDIQPLFNDDEFGVDSDADDDKSGSTDTPKMVQVMVGKYVFTAPQSDVENAMAQIRYANGFVKEKVEREIINRLMYGHAD